MHRRYGLPKRRGKCASDDAGFRQLFASHRRAPSRRDAKEHEDAMDSRLNALIVEAREHEIALQSMRPRVDATATRAFRASRARSSRRRSVRRFLRRRLATQQ
jgi:hypothetical protein